MGFTTGPLRTVKNWHGGRLIIYCSGGCATQVDYMVVRRKGVKNVIDAKVIFSDSIAQHHLLAMDMCLQHWTRSTASFAGESQVVENS